MEVAPQELAQLLKLAGVGAEPEPDMPEPEIDSEPEVSVMAIPSDDGAPVGGGCGAPEPEHDHPHEHGDMRSIIDMLKGGGEESIEEAPPKDDYENASKEFTGHPVDVIDSYDQYSYEPAKNSGMQRRTNSYGDNPLREEDLILEYTKFKKNSLSAIREALIDEASWWEKKAPTWLGGKSQAELDAEKAAETGPIDGEPGSEPDLRLGPMGQRKFMDKDSEQYKKNMAARPGSLTKPVPKQANTASSGVYDVEGPETALPGAQTRSNRQVAARNAQTNPSIASGGMKTNDPRARGPETFRGASAPTDPRARGPETFRGASAPTDPRARDASTFRGASVPTATASGGMKTNDPRARDASTFRGASAPTDPRARDASTFRKPEKAKSLFTGPANRRQTTVSSKYGDGMDRLKILAGI